MKKGLLLLLLFFIANMIALSIIDMLMGTPMEWIGNLILAIASLAMFFLAKNIANATN